MSSSERQTLGRYALHRVLGEGGMGRVYEAELHGPAGFRKRVAVKVLKEQGEQLVREAKLGGLLRHPNLVEVYELGWAEWEPPLPGADATNGTWFCAMELVTGGSVAELMPLSPRAVVDVGVQICAGLHHAHREVGLVHLDLKPANVLIEHGVVKVADLGISRATGFNEDQRVRGTPGYMAPEQRTGGAIDARADVYAIGILLLTLATGIRTGEPERVPWLERVARRCVDPDPNARYPSTEALRQALLALSVEGESLAERVGGHGAPARSGSKTTQDTYAMTGAAQRTNVVPESDAFVGRLDELGDLERRMDQGGVVTLKGLGGTGKTRLSKRALRRFLDGRTGGQAWFCDLVGAQNLSDIVATVASVLGVALDGLDEPGSIRKVGIALAGRRDVALVLDNLEQVVEHAWVVERWWQAAPEVRFLLTSRERLNIAGELVVELDPLPDGDAIRLLVARAHARGRDVAGDPALVELARRLDGLPLALELAAARFGLLSPAQVVDRLDQRFQLLVGGRRGESRQSTLHGALAWSWDLLNPWQRDALHHLTVFRGGFTLESAEAVLDLSEHPDAPWALDAVSALLDRSLVVVDGSSEVPRFRLFESVRVFASTRGTRQADLETRYSDHFAGLGTREGLDAIYGDDGSAAWDAYVAELENLKRAATLAQTHGQHGNQALCALAAAAVLKKRGPASQGYELLAAIQVTALAPALRARVRLAQAGCAMVAGDHTEVQTLTQLVLADPSLGVEARVRGWRLLGEAQVRACDNDAAMASLGQALDEQGGGGTPADRVAALRALGNLLLRQGRLEEAFGRYSEAMTLLRRHPDRLARGLLQINLGVLASHQGKSDVALGHYRDAARSLKRTGNAMFLGVALTNLGGLLINQGKVDEAAVSLERALRLHRNAGARGREVGALLMLGPLYWTAGDLERGHARTHRALALAEQQADPIHLGNAHRMLATFHRQEGTYASAHQHLGRALEAYQAAGLPTWERIWDVSMGWLRLAEGDIDAAFDHFSAGVGGLAPNSVAWLDALGGLAECLAHRGDVVRAYAEYERAMNGSQPYPELAAEQCVSRARVAGPLKEDAEAWLGRAESLVSQLGWGEQAPLRTQIRALR